MLQNGHARQCPLSYKIILLGDSNIGKSCFIQQFISNEFGPTQPTITVDFITKKYQIDEFSVQLNVFDTAGQQKYKSLTKAYLKGADAVLFMYSMDNKQSFQNVLHWVKYFEKESEGKDEVRVLVGTKKDLIDMNKGQQRLISKEQIKQFVQSHQFTFKFETSAKTNLNINLVFEQLSRNLIYNSIKRRKSNNLIAECEWPNILRKDKEHLIKQKGGCC